MFTQNHKSRTLALSLAFLLSLSCLSGCGSTPAAAETDAITKGQQEEGLSSEEPVNNQPAKKKAETSETANADKEQISEAVITDLHALFLQAAGDLSEIDFYQADFDGDGTDEAFGFAGKEDEYGEYSDTGVYYISSAGEVAQLEKGQIGYGQAWMFSVSGKSFVNWSISESPAAYGGTVDVFGVKDGKPYQPIEDYETSKGDIILGYSSSPTPGEVNAETYGFTDDGFREFRSQDYTFDTTTGKFVEK